MGLDARYLKRHQRMLGGLYQSVLRNELADRFGVEWAPIVNGQAEIAGVPKDLLAVFSKRAAAIDDAMAASSTSSVTVRAVTRRPRSAPPLSVKPPPIPGATSPGSVSPIWRHGGRARRPTSVGPSNSSSSTSSRCRPCTVGLANGYRRCRGGVGTAFVVGQTRCHPGDL